MPLRTHAKRELCPSLILLALLGGCLPGPTALPPELTVSVQTLSFTADPGGPAVTQTFSVTNSGAGTMPWTVTGTSAWITVAPASGTLTAGQSVQVTVSVSPATLAPGTHSGSVTVTGRDADPSTRSVPVEVTVRQPGRLALGGASLSFTSVAGSSPGSQTVTVTNSGGSSLSWTAAGNQSWLAVTPASGTLAAGQSATLTVAVSSSALTPGSYSGSVTVTAGQASNSPQSVAISLAVSTPGILLVGPSSLSFSTSQGSSPAGQTLIVTNVGSSSFSWTAAGNQSWLAVTPASGTLAAGQSATLTVAVSSTALAAGSYTGSLTVTAPGATGSPASVAVGLTVAAPGGLSVNPLSLSYSATAGTSPAPRTVTVTNSGGSAMNWTAATNQSWLGVTPASGTLAAGQSATLTVTVSSASLPVGSDLGTVTITAPGATGSPASVQVSLTVSAGAVLTLSTTALGGAAPQNTVASGTFQVTNSGTGTMAWSASEDAPWLTLSPTSGSLGAAASATVTATVNTAGLAIGVHETTVTVTAPGAAGSPKTLIVGVTVTSAGPAPTITARIPADTAKKVRIEEKIRVTFSQDMDPATLNSSTILLTRGDTAVSGTVTYDAGTRTATFTPAQPLKEFKGNHRVRVTTGARSGAGVAMASEATWTFQTVMFDPDYYYHLVNDFQGATLPMAIEAGDSGRCYHAGPTTVGSRWFLLDAAAYFGEGYFHVFNERFGYNRILTGGDGSAACSTIATPSNPANVPAAANWFPLYVAEYDRHRLHTQGGGIGPATGVGDPTKLALDDINDGQWRPWMRPSGALSGQFWRFFNAGKIPAGARGPVPAAFRGTAR